MKKRLRYRVHYDNALRRSREHNLAFDLDKEWIESRLKSGTCEATGVPFSKGNYKASIDRINPRGGYTKDNCRMVIWKLNSMKRNYSDDEIVEMAKLLMEARKDREQR